MKLSAQIQNGKLIFDLNGKTQDFLTKHEGERLEVVIQPKTRTLRQNNSLHLYFEQLAEALRDAGYDMRSIIREGIPIPCTAYHIKESLWRPTQKQMLGKDSTTKLTTEEIDKVYDVINRAIGERFGIYVPFPCIENLMD
jgi:hypothetical protein